MAGLALREAVAKWGAGTPSGSESLEVPVISSEDQGSVLRQIDFLPGEEIQNIRGGRDSIRVWVTNVFSGYIACQNFKREAQGWKVEDFTYRGQSMRYEVSITGAAPRNSIDEIIQTVPPQTYGTIRHITLISEEVVNVQTMVGLVRGDTFTLQVVRVNGGWKFDKILIHGYS